MRVECKNGEIAWAEFRLGHSSRAIQFAEYGLARNDECGSLWEVYGLSLMQAGRFEDGIDAIERASLLHPIGQAARIALAIAYGRAGRRRLSRELLMQAAIRSDVNEFSLLRIAAGLEAIDEPRLAMEACRRAYRLAPELAQVHYAMGVYASRAGHPPDLVEALARRAVDLEPRNIHYRVGLASLLIRLERSSEALQIIQRVADIDLAKVTCQGCLSRVANLFFDLGDQIEAARWADRLDQLRRSAAPEKSAHRERITSRSGNQQ